jgi:hypothetical protein
MDASRPTPDGAVRAWESRTLLVLGATVARYLLDNPPPTETALIGRLDDWALRLVTEGSRLNEVLEDTEEIG